MTPEIATRLKPIFKRDFKRARYQIACTYRAEFDGGNTLAQRMRIDRKSKLFHITKELYLECLDALGERTH